jgi:hypothetical protein
VRARLPVKKRRSEARHTRAFCEKKKHVEARTKRREGGTKARDFILSHIYFACSFLPFSFILFTFYVFFSPLLFSVWQGPFLFSRIQKKYSDATEKTKHTKAYQHIQK